MILQVKFNSLAELELNEAAQYYEGESPGLGSAFLREVRASIDSILKFPESGAAIRGNVRRGRLARFPYLVLYTTKQDEVRILAIMHSKRRPMYWAGRH